MKSLVALAVTFALSYCCLAQIRVSNYETGEVKREEIFKNGQLIKIVNYYQNGQKKSYLSYSSKNLDGKWIKWYENGQVFSKGDLRGRKPYYEGLFETWYDNGNKKSEITYKDGEYDGPWVAWHSNGNKKCEGTFKFNQRVGKWTTWHSNGLRRMERNYSPTGDDYKILNAWNSRGEALVQGGNGTITIYHKEKDMNGEKVKRSQTNYQEGKKHGPVQSWYQNGQLETEAQYDVGFYEGVVRAYYDDGKLMSESSYKKGLAEGKWKEWDKDGKLTKETDYAEGELLKGK